MTESISVDEFLATAAPRTDLVRVCARGDLVEEHIQLVSDLNNAMAVSAGSDSLASDDELSDEATAIAERIVEVEEEMEASTMSVKLRSLGARAWADLLREHPPPKGDRKHAHDPNTFPPAAVAACSVEPPISIEQGKTMFEQLHAGEWAKLWVAAINLNETPTPHPKLRAAADLLRGKRPSAGSPENTGSLAEPSSAGSGEQ